jgi:hypothetical protein
MLTYDPNVDVLATPIPPQEEVPINEELARQALARSSEENMKTVPQGLLRNYQPEKKVDESQMADFSTPIEEVMQNEVMGSPYAVPQAPSVARRTNVDGGSPPTESRSSKNPFGLTDEQFQAALAGAAAVVAFSKPVQERLRSMVPKFVGDSGDVSLTGLVVTALVAAIAFYFLKKLIMERA